MTDARFPERWLLDRRIMRLSDGAFRLLMVALTWSVSNRTEGALDRADLGLMLGVDPSCAGELVDAGLWAPSGDGWLIVEFRQTQTTRAQLEKQDRDREADRVRKAAKRAAAKQPSTRTSGRTSGRTLQDRRGEARTGTEEQPTTDMGKPRRARNRTPALAVVDPSSPAYDPFADPAWHPNGSEIVEAEVVEPSAPVNPSTPGPLPGWVADAYDKE